MHMASRILGAVMVLFLACDGLYSRDTCGPDVADNHVFRIDEQAQQHASFPKRIFHSSTGVAFRLVPAGEYTIGDDSLDDSCRTTVQVDAYYISERELNFQQVASLTRRVISTDANDTFVALSTGQGSSTSVCQIERARLVSETLGYVVAMNLLAGEIGALDDLRDQMWTYLGELERQSNAKDKPCAVSKDEYDQVLHFRDRVEDILRSLEERGDVAFDKAYFLTASRLADACSCSLPTEAQWEVAAQLTAAGELDLNGMSDDVYEWCSDFYDYRYFSRRGDTVNPRGPSAGRLTASQIEEITESSAPMWRVRSLSRTLRVVRGESVSSRHFDSPGGGSLGSHRTHPPRKMGIRLVVLANDVILERASQSGGTP